MIRFFKRGGCVFAVLCLLLSAGSCGSGELSPRADLRASASSRDASFTAVFPASYEGGEDVRCAGIRAGDTVTLTVTLPERMAGVTVTLRADGEGGYRTEISGPDFPAPAPVDPAAARALTDVFLLLYGTEADARADPDAANAASVLLPAVSRSGEETVFRCGRGTLAFGADGMPAWVLCRDMAGGERKVLFEGYVMTGP